MPVRTPPPSGPTPAIDNQEALARSIDVMGLRRLGFFLAVTFIFVRFSLISEILTEILGGRVALVKVLAPPTLLACILSGSIPRTIRHRNGFLYLCYLLWLPLTVPFSVWKGGSASFLFSTYTTEFSMFFIIGGLVYTLGEIDLVSKAISLAATVDVIALSVFGQSVGGRFGMPFGTLGNPNDLAIHLIVIFPFVLRTAMMKGNLFWRLLAFPTLALGLYYVMLTGSRTALLVLGVMGLIILFRASMTQRIAVLAGMAALSVIGVMIIPSVTLQRYLTTFGGAPEQIVDVEEYRGAVGSTEARMNLLRNSIALTFENPLFGVGPGMFAVGEADKAEGEGRRGAWQVTHNTYTEVSSESGLPAFFAFVGALLTTLFGLNRALSEARRRRDSRDLADTAFYLLLCMFGFAASIFFGSMAYRFYMPSLIGLSTAFLFAANREMRLRAKSAPAQPSRIR